MFNNKADKKNLKIAYFSALTLHPSLQLIQIVDAFIRFEKQTEEIVFCQKKKHMVHFIH